MGGDDSGCALQHLGWVCMKGVSPFPMECAPGKASPLLSRLAQLGQLTCPRTMLCSRRLPTEHGHPDLCGEGGR